MLRSLRRSLLLALMLPVPLVAQDGAADSFRTAAAREVLSAHLRRLITTQEVYDGDNMTYAASVRALASLQYAADSGVTVVLLTSSTTGHSEIALSDAVPELVCASDIGEAPPPMGSAMEGEVVCRSPGPP